MTQVLSILFFFKKKIELLLSSQNRISAKIKFMEGPFNMKEENSRDCKNQVVNPKSSHADPQTNDLNQPLDYSVGQRMCSPLLRT